MILHSPTPQQSGAFGQAVAISGNYVVVGAPFQTVSGLTQSGDAYVYNLASTPVTTLVDPALGNLSRFGYAVATNGNLVAVSAPFETSDGSVAAGNVYLYTVSGSYVATFTSPNASSHLEFGFSLAMDSNWLVIGAPNQWTSWTSESGAAYIVNLQTFEMRMVFSPVPQGLGQFGASVSLSGNSFVVGAPTESVGALGNAGNAYVFSAVSGDVIANFSSPVPLAGSQFGTSVAISGPFVVVGEPEAPVSGPTSGHAYEFNLVTDTVRELNTSASTNNGQFGISVAADANTVLVGAWAENSGGHAEVGNAYLYSARSGGVVTSVFSPPTWPAFGGFGESLAEAGGPVVIGAPAEYSAGVEYAGLVYVYDQIPLTFTSPHQVSYGHSGEAVAVAGGIMVVGAPGEIVDVHPVAGHAYVVPIDPSPSLSVLTLTSPNPEDGSSFGQAVATTGTIVAIGASGESPGGLSGAGRVYLFNAFSGALLLTLVSPSPAAGGGFGYALSFSGGLLAVGAPGEPDPTVAGGNVYVFNATTGTLVRTVTSPSPVANGEFGYSVSMSGSSLLVGAPFENASGVSGSGRAYLFDEPSGVLRATLSSPAPALEGNYGLSVSVYGSLAVVGEPGASPLGVREAGEAYSYSSVTGVSLHTFLSPDPGPSAQFGGSVGTNGVVIVVSAPDATAVGLTGAGLVYIFSVSTYLPIDRLNSPAAKAGGLFGWPVAVGSSRLAVGAPYEAAAGLGPTGGQIDQAGFAYLFCLSNWSQV